MNNLNGKKILFIAQKIYGYEYEIKTTIESLGASVDFYHERPHNFVYRVARNKYPRLLKKLNNSFFDSILLSTSKKKYDYVFIIRAEILTIDFLNKLRISQPTSKFIMYQWDSNKLNPFFDKIPFFDKVYSFDMVDCATNKGLTYLPLFFRKEYDKLREEVLNHDAFKIDLLLIGSFHKNREEVVMKIKKLCDANNVYFHAHLFISRGGVLKHTLRGQKLTHYSNKSLDTSEIIEMYKESKVILDIHQPDQDGFTMRTFEVLGSGKKLLTTNKNILNASFYNTETISVFDLEKMDIDFNFMKTNTLIDAHLDIQNYSISNWVKTIFQ